MPLPLPKLDNRTFDQLFEEARSLIPRHAPAWSDHNYHDPGITLIDLFAWLFEMDIYRLDRIEEASYRAFLRLVGVELHGPQPAVAELALALALGSDLLALPAGIQFGSGQVGQVFKTLHPINISPARLLGVQAGRPGELHDYSAANLAAGQLYPPFGDDPQPGSTLVLEFDRPLSGDPDRIHLYVWIDPARDDQIRRRLVEQSDEEAELTADCPPGSAPAPWDWRLHYSARTVWEYAAAEGGWMPLGEVEDETRALSLSGPVSFTSPSDHAPGPDGRFAIRCRLLSGTYECPPWVDRIGLNVVRLAHAADLPAEVSLGLSRGAPGQVYDLPEAPAVPGSLHLRSVLNGQEQYWDEVRDWDRSGPHAGHFLLEAERGRLVFGDGRVGQRPPAGAEILASYQVGGGEAGNLPSGAIRLALDNPRNRSLVAGWEAIAGSLEVEQPYPARGGAAAESLASARGRALQIVRHRERAVTAEDFEGLARQVPGLPVARARVIPNRHPDLPCFPAPGCLTVVVVPDCPGARPIPGPDFLAAVARYLDRRRSLTTEVHVVGPCYTGVSVHADLHLEPDAIPDGLVELARRELEAFFHPLSGGPDRNGWPIGRSVYRSEILALLSALPGVSHIENLGLLEEGQVEPLCTNLPVCPDCLAASGDHRIRIIERSSN
jgi:predicted phage baseplate assembly protein